MLLRLLAPPGQQSRISFLKGRWRPPAAARQAHTSLLDAIGHGAGRSIRGRRQASARKEPYYIFRSSNLAAVWTLRVTERLQASRRGAGESQCDALASRRVQPVLGRLTHQFGSVAIGENESGTGGKDIEQHMLGGCEEQAIAMHPVVAPFLIGAKILDRGFDLHDPDFAVAAERHNVGPASGKQRQLGDAG